MHIVTVINIACITVGVLHVNGTLKNAMSHKMAYSRNLRFCTLREVGVSNYSYHLKKPI